MISASADIQIIDDQPQNLKILRKMLTNQGYRVRTSINGEMALASAFEVPPDLILLDIRMPIMDGYEVCLRLKADHRTRNIPVLFLSALSDVSDKVRAFAAGGADYITKPFYEEEVLARVATHLNLHRTQKALAAEVTAHHRARQVHQTEREQFELALKDSPVVVFIHDTALRYTWIHNPHPTFNPDTVLGKTDADLLPPAEAARLMALKQQVLATGQPVRQEVQVTFNDQPHWYDLSVDLQRDGAGQISGLRCTTTDITDRVESHLARQESEAKYRLLIENANTGIVLFDTAGNYQMLNEHIARMLGGAPADFVGKSIREVFPDQADFHMQRFEKILREKKGGTFEDPFPLPDGIHWYSSNIQPVLDSDGNVTAIQIVAIDITHKKQAEEALRANERLLRSIAANYPNAYVSIIEKDLTIGFTAGQEFTKLNLDPDQFVGHTLEQVFGEHAPYVKERYVATFNGQSTEFELFINKQHQLYQTVPLADNDGQINRILVVVRNETERKQLFEKVTHLNSVLHAIRNVNQLIVREKNQHRLIEQACYLLTETRGFHHAWIALLDEHAHVSAVAEPELNQAFSPIREHIEQGQQIFCMQQALAQPGSVVVANTEGECAGCPLAKDYPGSGGLSIRLEREGVIFGVLTVTAPASYVTDPEERALFEELAGDIALALHSIKLEEQHRQAETALQKREAELRLVLNNTRDMIFAVDQNYRLITANRAFIEATISAGGQPLELGQSVLSDDYPPDFRARWQSYYDRALNGEVVEVNTTLQWNDGVHHMANIITPLKLDDNRIEGAVVLSRDVTERHRAEEALRISEERFRQLAENSPELVYRYRLSHTPGFDYVSPSATVITGYTPQEHYDDPQLGYKLVHPDDRHLLDQAASGLGDMLVLRWQRKDGATIWTEQRNVPILDAAGNLVAIEGVARDITERKLAEDSLRQLTQAIEQSPVSVMITDTEGIIKYVNPKFTQVTGYSAPEVIGQNPRILQSNEQSPEFYQEMWDTITAGNEWRGEFRNRKKNGELFWELASIAGVKDENGKITHYVSVKEDITERKLLEDQHVRQERMAAVGKLAAGIAHDFNNLLTAITGFAELLHHRPDMSASAKNDLSKIIERSQHAAKLTRQILDFSSKTINEPKPLDLRIYLNETLKFIERTIPESIRVRFNFERGDHTINADPTQMHQVIANLAVNARDVMPDGGTLYFNLSRTQLDHTNAPCPNLSPGTWVVLAVKDTGSGIAPDVLPHIFEPFFTTKKFGQGTGLGLAQIYGIVQQHHGCITVDSTVGQGATFTLYFPALPEPAEPETIDDSTSPAGNGETILLVEDDRIVLHVTRAMLEILNYQVVTAKNGEEALALYRSQPDRIAAVLTDVVMPGIDGLALATLLQAESPGLPILAMSGYAGDSEGLPVVMENITARLQKPLNLHSLANALTQVLAEQKN